MLLEKTKIYGVNGVGKSSPTLERTNASVGLTYNIGTSEITSDFDSCYPWVEMKEIVDEFGNVFIRIPKFYSKVTKNEDDSYAYQISGCRYDGFSTLFIDGMGNELDYVLIGKYEASGTSSKAYSKTDSTCLVNITIEDMRTACKANGDGYQQYDFIIDAIIKELFMIEFATTNTQSIMKGFINSENPAALITGHTDKVSTASGSYNNNHDLETDPWVDTTCNTDGRHACKYRGIENPFGNVWTMCDGINFDNEKVYLCENPLGYEGDKYEAPYFYVANRILANDYLKGVTQFAKNPLLGYATLGGAGEGSYYCDYCCQMTSGTRLVVGGDWDNGNSAGLWYWNAMEGSTHAGSNIGGRLCYKPI